MSRTGSAVDFATMSMPGSYSGGVSILGSFSNLHSTDVSGAQSPQSEMDSSDEGMEDDDYATPM